MNSPPDSIPTPRAAVLQEQRLCQHAMLVRPALFGWNQETAGSNRFQAATESLEVADVHAEALREFDGLRDTLVRAGVQVHTFDDELLPATPDAIFPNNWVSFHGDGTRILYPMHAPNRRNEVRVDWIESLEESLGLTWKRAIDLRPLCDAGHFLEGTGSLILDRRLRVAYAALSQRTTREGLAAFAKATDYEIVALHTQDGGHPVYHTNVMMSLGRDHAMVCLQSIPLESERIGLRNRLEAAGLEIIEIDRTQMARFAANQITLADADGVPQIVLSQRALASLRPDQVRRLEHFGNLWAPRLNTIEHYGGGSARCMVAEVAPPQDSSHA